MSPVISAQPDWSAGLSEPKKGASPLCLEQAAFSERHRFGTCDDEMIQYADIDQRERLLQRLGQKFVGAAGFGNPGGVVVGEDHRRGVVSQRGLNDLAGVDAGLRERAAEQLFVAD